MTHKKLVPAPTYSSTALLHALNDVAVLRVSGDDARSWLNGQVTNDVRATKAGDSVYALVINLKGRVVADVWIYDEGNSFLLVVPSSSRESVLTQFEKYIIMEDVTLSHEADLRAVTIQASNARALGGDALAGCVVYAANRLHPDGIDALIRQDAFDRVWKSLSRQIQQSGGRILDDAAWRNECVDRALPLFGSEFGDKTYPQEAGLESRAVSFNKGCYLGQEVVCMLENRGQLTRRLVALELKSAPEASDATVSTTDGQPIGELTSVNAAKSHALAMIRRSVATPGTELRVGGAAAVVAHIVER